MAELLPGGRKPSLLALAWYQCPRAKGVFLADLQWSASGVAWALPLPVS